MIKTVLFIFAICASVCLPAQGGVDRVVSQIERNNASLQALSQQIKADKLGTRVGLYPENPEINFGFLNGTPSALGRRRDFSVRQSFDFPLAYIQKSRLADGRSSQLDWEWQKQRHALLLEARLLCLDLVHANAMQLELKKRLASAKEMAAAFEAKFERGDANILERNRVQLNLLTIQQGVEHNDIERGALQAELSRLNGGQAVELPDATFPAAGIAEEFESWYGIAEQNNPQLQWLKKEVQILDTQVKLDRSLSLPKIAVGYMSETVDGERYQGVTAGLSIPLFERKNAVRFGKAKAVAMRLLEADGRVQFYDQMKALHARVVAMQRSIREFRAGLAGLDNTPLLKKALEKGEISLIEYVLELAIHYASAERLLQEELVLARHLAVLNQYNRHTF